VTAYTREPLRLVPGEWVSHARYGDGLVLSVDGKGNRRKAEVEFTHGRIWLVLATAPIVKTTTPSAHPVRLRPGEHPDWCARDHRCNLGEHRAEPVTVAHNRAGTIVLTRVLAANGRQHVEIRTRIELAPGEAQSRRHLGTILTDLQAHLHRVIQPS
jgi:hypothetical protein